MDIFDLFMPTFSGSKDEYSKDVVPPLPLSIDRVMESRPRKSTAPLLQLASELLAIILFYVDLDSLGSLALVNSDCRQLARSSQFASVCFDYSYAASDLISVLLEETTLRDRSKNNLAGIEGAIGPCIRRLTVATNPGWVTHLHDIELSQEFNALEKVVKDERLARASDAFSRYQRRIESVLSSRATLPNLELLDWEDRVPLQQSFFQSLTTSGIQHLKLNRVTVNQEFEIFQPSVSSRWNLRTLNMNILWSIQRFGKGGTSPLCTSLLRSCSHSLETLIWHQTTFEKYTFGSDLAKIPRFEKLRKLGIGFTTFSDSSIINALLEPHLSVLDLNYCGDIIVQQAIQNRGRIPSLETLLLFLTKSSFDSYLKFLMENTQISQLTILADTNPEEGESYEDFPEEKILRTLSSSFHAIKSLRLTRSSRFTTIPDAVLAIISRIKTLEQLCLGTGCQIGWKFDWLIDHKSMRSYLSILPRLKKIAFTRDSYKQAMFFSTTSHETYYSDQFLSLEEMDAAGLDGESEEALIQVWEERHKGRMVLEAEKYVALMPKLEWMYLGQYPMAVMKGALEEEKHVVPQNNERDSCDTFLSRMFGSELAFD